MEIKHIICAIILITILACIFTSNMGALAFIGNDVNTDLMGLVQGTSPLVSPPPPSGEEEGEEEEGEEGGEIENFGNYSDGYWGYPFRYQHMKGVYPYRYQKKSGVTHHKHKYLPLYRPYRYWNYCYKQIPAGFY